MEQTDAAALVERAHDAPPPGAESAVEGVDLPAGVLQEILDRHRPLLPGEPYDTSWMWRELGVEP